MAGIGVGLPSIFEKNTLTTNMIGFFYSTTVIVDEVVKFSNKSFKSFLFNGFYDVHDFVVIHEITSSFGLWPPNGSRGSIYYYIQAYVLYH